MKQPHYKALALDLDGTLTDSHKKIPLQNKEAIWKAIDRGVTIILASGRAPMGMTGLAKELELNRRGGIITAFNGGKIIDCKTNEIILNIELPHELIPSICHIAAKYHTAPVSYTDTHVVSEYDTDRYVLHECKCNGTTVQKVTNLPEFLYFPVNKLMIAGEHEPLVNVRDELLSLYGDRMVSFFSESFFLEASPTGVGKDLALEAICKHLNITKEDLMVCGDGLNDIPMFDFGGFSVAMKNAYPEAAAHADLILPKTNDECGVAFAIEKYLL